MKMIISLGLTIIFSVGLTMAFTGCSNDSQSITSVHDGDTVWGGPVPSSKLERLRLYGVNTPGVGGREGLEPYGSEATQFVKDWIAKNTCSIMFSFDKKGAVRRGSWGRPLVYIVNEAGEILNIELVRNGFSDIATYGKKLRYMDQFKSALTEAKQAKRRIWSGSR